MSTAAWNASAAWAPPAAQDAALHSEALLPAPEAGHFPPPWNLSDGPAAPGASVGNGTSPAARPPQLLRHDAAVNAVLCAAYLLVFVAGVLGNSFVIAVVCRCPRMRNATNFFIVNLAVADILVLVFCLPANLISNIFYPWIMGRFMCKAVTYVQGVSVSASVNSLVAISLDRFLAICCGLRCHVSKRRARVIIGAIWALPVLIMMPWPMFFDLRPQGDAVLCQEMWPDHMDANLFFLMANLILCYLFPLMLIILCYVGIWLKVSRRDIPGDSKDVQLCRMQQRSKFKVVKMLMAVVVVFALSWLPLYAIWLLLKFADLERLPAGAQRVLGVAVPLAQWLGASNSCVNPALYAYFNKKYRQGFQAVLRSGSCCARIRLDAAAQSTVRRTALCRAVQATVTPPAGQLALLTAADRRRQYRAVFRSVDVTRV